MTGYDSIGEELEDIHELFEDFGANANNLKSYFRHKLLWHSLEEDSLKQETSKFYLCYFYIFLLCRNYIIDLISLFLSMSRTF